MKFAPFIESLAASVRVQSRVYVAIAAAAARSSVIPRWVLHLGALGVFATAGLPLLPIPAADILIIVLAAHGESPWLLVLAGVASSLIGGYLFWAAGKKGGEALLNRHVGKSPRLRSHVIGWIQGHGIRGIVLATLLPPPFPLFPFLIAAGALGITRRQFFISVAIGRAIRYGTAATLAAIYGPIILRLWNRYLADWSTPILYAFLALIAAGAVFGIWKFRREQRRSESRPHPA